MREQSLLQASERPLRATGSVLEKAAARFDVLIRESAKTAVGELKGEAPGNPDRVSSVPCMPVVSEAVNRVTWNHFLFLR
jgi:hypothetical protein